VAKKVAADRVAMLRGLLADGVNPNRAAVVAGVSKSFAYDLDRAGRGVSRLVAGREAAAARRAARLAGPGRRVAAERVRLLADQLRSGLSPYRAAAVAGVSKTFAYDLHKKMGGVYRPADTTYSDRYLDRDRRYEIARLHEQGLSCRVIGERIGFSPSAVCRELNRNKDPRTGNYLPEKADQLAWERQRRPKASKLSASPALAGEVQRMLHRRYSPEQVSGRLKVEHPDDPGMHVSHESIYQSIYLYPRGELKRELQACLRTGRTIRRPRGRREMRGKIVAAVPIGERPPEVEGRLKPGHHEGDLVMGSKASNSAVGTLVERTTGFLTLLCLPHGHDAASVADAVIDRMSVLPAWFAKTLTWDRGTELAQHARITSTTGIQVYFADPYSPWQRGSNENTNGLLREYLPKGTDLSVYTPAQLQAIEDELNDRPRKRLGYRTPREETARLLEQERVATTP
jgi:IS30 family transposase